ncbi:hypothetical protein [Alteromonas sp. BMJM2]|uniref:hypothetical protein n=1 Tax=Alteromonas sp. BMJM2 TaxID=2954241 RepID=UPI0022B4899B|nr:hypothetical protein [Alteromonas sp. BMJM2]
MKYEQFKAAAIQSSKGFTRPQLEENFAAAMTSRTYYKRQVNIWQIICAINFAAWMITLLN